MVSIEILCGIVAVLLLWYIYTLQYRYQNRPPGPFVLPVIGNFLSIWSLRPSTINPHSLRIWEYFDEWYKVYGDIFSVTAGKFSAVVIPSYDLMAEVANMDEYSWKCVTEFSLDRSFGEELGLIFVANNDIWVEMRKFSQRTLRDFGFGKRNSMHNVISDEISHIVQRLKDKVSKEGNGIAIVRIQTLFILSVLNVLWCMIAGKKYSINDPKLVKMMDRNFTMTKKTVFASPLMLTFPWLFKTFPKLLGTTYMHKVFNECHDFSKDLIDERKAEGRYQSDPENYIDCFLQKIEGSNDKENTIYTEKQLQLMIEDFLQTGSTTTNGTLNYAILFLILNPEVQRKCQEEIDSVVSSNLIPTLEDIDKMPYFQATILEVHRLGCVVPNPIPRILLKDWKLRGYWIPKGTFIVTNHYSMMMDKSYWKDPEVFRPERFLDSAGKFINDKHVVHFGVGKRNCIGMALSNSVIPIYIATLLQNFNFSMVPGKKRPTMKPEIGVSLSPKPFKTLVTIRNNN